MSGNELTRQEFFRRTAAVTVVAGGIGGLSSLADAAVEGGGDTLARARKQGFIRVGFANEAPYGFADSSGKLTGAAPAIAQKIFTSLGIKEMDGVLTEFASLIPGLQAKRFDATVAGMFVTPERCKQVLFADPFYIALEALAVKAGNPLGLHTYKDVAAKKAKLGVLAGAVEGDLAKDVGVSGSKIVIFPDATSGFDGLLAGRVDAFTLTSITVRWQIKLLNNKKIEAGPSFQATLKGKPFIGGGGFNFRKSDTTLRNAFNAKLLAMMRSGQATRLAAPFGWTNAEIAGALKHPAAQLCQG